MATRCTNSGKMGPVLLSGPGRVFAVICVACRQVFAVGNGSPVSQVLPSHNV